MSVAAQLASCGARVENELASFSGTKSSASYSMGVWRLWRAKFAARRAVVQGEHETNTPGISNYVDIANHMGFNMADAKHLSLNGGQ